MTAVFMLRHPQSRWNSLKRYQGRLDPPLSEEGKRQVRALARVFPSRSLQAIYSSPLQRARHLAEEMARATKADLVCDSRLTEMAQGPWEGLYVSEIRQRHRRLFDLWYSRPDLVRFPNGESPSDVQQRGCSVLEHVFREHPDTSVAVVTHAVVVQVIAAASLALHLRHLHNIRIGNGSITTLCGSGVAGSLMTLNDTEPLYGGPLPAAQAVASITVQGGRMTT